MTHIVPRVLRSALTGVGLLLVATAVPTVAHADVCDLTTVGSSCGPATGGTGSGTTSTFNAGGAIFTQMNQQPTGTGYIDSFLRIQKNGGGIESGYNTNNQTYQFDQKDPINYTHAIQLQDIPTVTINGKTYYQFGLDINEATGGGKNLISLDELQIFLLNTATANNYVNNTNPNLDTLNGVTAAYSMDTATTNNWIKLDYALNSGSGSGDMYFYLPTSYLASATPTTYVYLYSLFGTNFAANDGKLSSDAGFEEWWVDKSLLKNPPKDTVPEPTTTAMLGLGVALLVRRMRRGRRA